MWSVRLLAIVTLLVRDREFDDEGLLEHGVGLDFLLDSNFDFDSSRVGFGPDKGSVEQLHALQALDVFETQREQICAFELASDPRRPQVPIALAAVVKNVSTRDAFGDVDLALEAADACICSVWLGHHAAHAAPYLQHLQ